MFTRLATLLAAFIDYFRHDCGKTISEGVDVKLCCRLCKEAFLEKSSLQHHHSFVDQRRKISLLDVTDPEHKTAESRFLQSTCRGYKILSIHKNETPYSLEFASNRHAENEKLLFHGTPVALNHSSILSEGFKLKYARHGLLGCGVYFSDNVDYSDNGYCFRTTVHGRNVRTILLCRVLLVSGKYTKDEGIQAIYDEDLCFPAYLITYGH
jgi:hypothetical protein